MKQSTRFPLSDGVVICADHITWPAEHNRVSCLHSTSKRYRKVKREGKTVLGPYFIYLLQNYMV